MIALANKLEIACAAVVAQEPAPGVLHPSVASPALGAVSSAKLHTMAIPQIVVEA
jgi:hypothetical protein